MPFEQWRDTDNLVARVNLPNMAHPPERRVEVYAAAVRGLAALEPDADRRTKYLEFIDIYAGLDDNEREEYRRQYPEENRVMVGIVERARRQGREEGIERGIEQGGVRGRRSMLERQLRRRFGGLAPEVAERLRRASAEELEAWGESLLDADTPEGVFGPA